MYKKDLLIYSYTDIIQIAIKIMIVRTIFFIFTIRWMNNEHNR